MTDKIKSTLNKILAAIFPERCVCCGASGGKAICQSCENAFVGTHIVRPSASQQNGMKAKTGADSVFFAYKYGNKTLTKAIFALKERNNAALADYFADKIYASVKQIKVDIITNAPRSGENKNRHGYDHAALLAKRLAPLMGVKYENLLAEKTSRAEQKTLNLEERRINTEGGYKVTAKYIPKAVLIVDDVCTSGETLKECIAMLRGAGAETLFAAVIANRM